ncbi:uncharacterized protein MONBRDRAFT_10254 [Monosiga brevicollis MX1]|uniref:DUF4590 domain-containing protein n=1 Tax=Monosiga brevicollis TaxID=81824 RepID=A9V5N9_MONBE|nr:uncharacterized protein MONBRDRAFT_10254 [Monosiga brevicollis MX1]EDQ87151.1 predicted protein [Monosiga brevicollis MX1]|eukprot:XP_001748094.1 hypothetical protein [Monosiga brevicollis MX1]
MGLLVVLTTVLTHALAIYVQFPRVDRLAGTAETRVRTSSCWHPHPDPASQPPAFCNSARSRVLIVRLARPGPADRARLALRYTIVQQDPDKHRDFVLFDDIIPNQSTVRLRLRLGLARLAVVVRCQGMVQDRWSTCCPFKYAVGSRLGGRRGHFVVEGLEGMQPCPSCQLALVTHQLPEDPDAEEVLSTIHRVRSAIHPPSASEALISESKSATTSPRMQVGGFMFEAPANIPTDPPPNDDDDDWEAISDDDDGQVHDANATLERPLRPISARPPVSLGTTRRRERTLREDAVPTTVTPSSSSHGRVWSADAVVTLRKAPSVNVARPATATFDTLQTRFEQIDRLRRGMLQPPGSAMRTSLGRETSRSTGSSDRSGGMGNGAGLDPYASVTPEMEARAAALPPRAPRALNRPIFSAPPKMLSPSPASNSRASPGANPDGQPVPKSTHVGDPETTVSSTPMPAASVALNAQAPGMSTCSEQLVSPSATSGHAETLVSPAAMSGGVKATAEASSAPIVLSHAMPMTNVAEFPLVEQADRTSLETAQNHGSAATEEGSMNAAAADPNPIAPAAQHSELAAKRESATINEAAATMEMAAVPEPPAVPEMAAVPEPPAVPEMAAEPEPPAKSEPTSNVETELGAEATLATRPSPAAPLPDETGSEDELDSAAPGEAMALVARLSRASFGGEAAFMAAAMGEAPSDTDSEEERERRSSFLNRSLDSANVQQARRHSAPLAIVARLSRASFGDVEDMGQGLAGMDPALDASMDSDGSEEDQEAPSSRPSTAPAPLAVVARLSRASFGDFEDLGGPSASPPAPAADDRRLEMTRDENLGATSPPLAMVARMSRTSFDGTLMADTGAALLAAAKAAAADMSDDEASDGEQTPLPSRGRVESKPVADHPNNFLARRASEEDIVPVDASDGATAVWETTRSPSPLQDDPVPEPRAHTPIQPPRSGHPFARRLSVPTIQEVEIESDSMLSSGVLRQITRDVDGYYSGDYAGEAGEETTPSEADLVQQAVASDMVEEGAEKLDLNELFDSSDDEPPMGDVAPVSSLLRIVTFGAPTAKFQA